MFITIITLTAACATNDDKFALGARGVALAPQTGGPLAAAEAVIRNRGITNGSGFSLLDSNADGLQWRLALIDSAEHSLDLQYYVWFADLSGKLLMKRVVDAADRGVKVRIIVDDLSTMLIDETHVASRDEIFSAFDAHPNIEIRLFNVWQSRSIPGRLVESLNNAERVNHRMHNKSMVADNRAAIIGGRNVGDHYFGLSPKFNFRDLDVIGIGAIARQASTVFDRFWNSELVVPVSSLHDAADIDALVHRYNVIVEELTGQKGLAHIHLQRQNWRPALLALAQKAHPGTSRTHTDRPDTGVLEHHMPQALTELLASAREEVLIVNAYIIPGEHAIARIREQIANGVKYRILTNSLASHDVPAVNSHYKKWRKRFIDVGVELYELRPDAAIKSILAEAAPYGAEFVGLHAKAVTIDSKRVFIGSMNLDPRSWEINSEMGVVIESEGLAEILATVLTRDMQPINSWRVVHSPEGGLQWVAGEDITSIQPAREFWQRIEDVIFMAFPQDLY
ncbi:MAG: phospholipase D family protein [Gammaproteobacteria bacterium]